MLQHLGYSLYRLAIGYTFAVMLGVLFGALFAMHDVIRNLIKPITKLMISLPTLAWLPILLVAFGLGDATVIVTVFIGSFFVICLNTMVGIELVPMEIKEAGMLDGANSLLLIGKILLPNARVSVFTGLRLGWAYAWRALVGAEMLAAMIQWGIGRMIYDARFWNDTRTMLLGLVVVGSCGYVGDWMLKQKI